MGAKSGEIWFLPLETKKTAFFAEIFKFVAPFRHPCLCVGKSSCHTLKINVISSVLTPSKNSEILLILIRKMKYLTDQYQLCFCFCIGNTK